MCLIFNCSLWTEEGKKWGIYTSLPFTPKEDQRLWLRRIPGELLGQGLTWTRLSFGEAEKIKPVLPGIVTFKHQHSDSGNGMCDIFWAHFGLHKHHFCPFRFICSPTVFIICWPGGWDCLNVRFEACVCEFCHLI